MNKVASGTLPSGNASVGSFLSDLFAQFFGLPGRRDFQVICGLTTLLAAVLLFARIGHYALWDDEAVTALTAKGVLLTGDTSALLDHNIVAYRDGCVLRDLKDRSSPPLPTYLTAVSLLIFGKTAFAARIPSACFALLAVIVSLTFASQWCKTRTQLLIFCTALLGNVSFFLYARQCRYYSLTLLLAIAIGAVYLSWQRRNERQPALIGVLFAILFASHSLTCVCLFAALALDFLIWRRNEQLLTARSLASLIIPQALISAPIACVWNPFRTAFGEYATRNGLADRLTLWFWHWRDMNQCEFMSGGLMVLAVGVALLTRDKLLIRGLVASLAFITVLSVASPQIVQITSVADVRYAAVLIPLFLAIESRTVWRVTHRHAPASVILALIVFGTNILNGGPLLSGGLRSTLMAYAGELLYPVAEPYTPTAAWLRDHVAPRQSVWVIPDHCTYPLMFHAPDPTYAWQLSSDQGQFSGLPPIHFRGRTPPDYIVIFGPLRSEMVPILQEWRLRGVRYDGVAELKQFWKDLYRPELFWRSFVTVLPSPNRFEGIYIFKRQSDAPTP
jgi:4-amino-4-deoxy-L-arabinose transferase-like glycosyltransferase